MASSQPFASLVGRVDGRVAVEAKAMYLKVGLDHFVPHARRMGERMSDRPYNPLVRPRRRIPSGPEPKGAKGGDNPALRLPRSS